MKEKISSPSTKLTIEEAKKISMDSIENCDAFFCVFLNKDGIALYVDNVIVMNLTNTQLQQILKLLEHNRSATLQ